MTPAGEPVTGIPEVCTNLQGLPLVLPRRDTMAACKQGNTV